VHAGQRRKETPVPYLAHLLGVAAIVLEDRGNEDEAIAALLHDAPEDQGGRERLDDICRRFGKDVGTIVNGCTDTLEKVKPDWLPRKQAYLAHLRKERSLSVLRVSGADKLHNLRAITADFYADGAHVFCRFKGGKEGTLWYHACLLNVYREHAREGRLSEALHRQIEAAFIALQQVAESTFRWPASESELPTGWLSDRGPLEAICRCGQTAAQSSEE
jgi:(p)ppGpp synthase/HD superfamily hydrolase